MYFEVYQDKRNQWRWTLRGVNGEIIADSAESYVRREDCEHGIALIREGAPAARVVREG